MVMIQKDMIFYMRLDQNYNQKVKYRGYLITKRSRCSHILMIMGL